MIVWLLVIALFIVCANLIFCLIQVHKSKETNNLVDATYKNVIITAILYKFVSNIYEQTSEKVVHNCMLNAIKRCINNEIISVDSESDETEVCEKVAKEIYQTIIENEREDD